MRSFAAHRMALSFMMIILAPLPTTLSASPKPRIGLWAPCEGDNKTLSSPEKIVAMLDFARRQGVTDIFLQVYRRNLAWYPSKIVPDTPYRQSWTVKNTDPLRTAIQEGAKRGIRIHAWFNVYWIGKERDAAILKKLGGDVITRDQKGRSLLEYENYVIPPPERGWYSYGEDGLWLEPGDDRVQKYLLSVFDEVASNYPGLAGIHLDFVRLPFTSPYLPGSYYAITRGIEFGYGTRSVERFAAKYQMNPRTMKRTVRNHQLWDQWRRDQITDLLRTIKASWTARKLDRLELSCAALPWPERSYFSSYQDWMRWLREGPVDFIVTMNYTLDSALAQNLSMMALGLARNARAWIGLGAYLFGEDDQSFSKQLRDTAHLAPPGIVLFSYDGLLKQEKVTRAAREIFKAIGD